MADITSQREKEKAEVQDRIDDLRVTYILTEPEARRVIDLVDEKGVDGENTAVAQVRSERVGAAKRAAANPSRPDEVFARNPKLKAKWFKLRTEEAKAADQAERDAVAETIAEQEAADEAEVEETSNSPEPSPTPDQEGDH